MLLHAQFAESIVGSPQWFGVRPGTLGAGTTQSSVNRALAKPVACMRRSSGARLVALHIASKDEGFFGQVRAHALHGSLGSTRLAVFRGHVVTGARIFELLVQDDGERAFRTRGVERPQTSMTSSPSWRRRSGENRQRPCRRSWRRRGSDRRPAALHVPDIGGIGVVDAPLTDWHMV